MPLKTIQYVGQPNNQIFEEVKDGKTVRYALIEMFRTGVFEHCYYGKLNIDLTYLKTMHRNWKNQVHPTPVSFDRDHNHSSGATAWLPSPEEDPKAVFIKKKTIKSGEKPREVYVLCAKVRMTEMGYELVEKELYKYFSIEVQNHYRLYEVHYEADEKGQVSEEERKDYGPTIVGGALTNFPFIIGMEPVSLSFSLGLPNQHETKDDDSLKAMYGKDDDVLMLFSSEFAKKKADEEEEEEDVDTEDEEEVDEPEAKDDEEESEVEDDAKKDSGKGKPSKESKKGKSKNEYEDTESGSTQVAMDTTISLENEAKESTMDLSAILASLKDLNTADQVAKLESHVFSASEDHKVILNSLLESKRQLALKEKEIANEVQKRTLKEKEVETLQASVISLSTQAEQNKQVAYSQRVELFCNDLEKQNHFPSVIEYAKSVLNSVKADQRDMKFSVIDGASDKELDLFSLFSGLLETLPEDARFSATGEILNASAQAPSDATPDKTEAKPDVKQDKFDLFFSKLDAEDQKSFGSADAIRKDELMADRINDAGEIVLKRSTNAMVPSDLDNL